MNKLDLSMSIEVYLGQNEYNRIPRIESKWMTIDAFTSKGGALRGFTNGMEVLNEMEVGDEIRETIQQENLIVYRKSDEYTSQIYQAWRNQRIISVWFSIELSQYTTLSLYYAKISSITLHPLFNKETDKKPKYDRITIVFEKENARVNYGNQSVFAPQQIATPKTTAAIGG